MLQRTATMNVSLHVRSKNQYNSHRAKFIRRCGTLSDTPSRISSLIQLHLVLSLLGFLLGGNFLFVFDLMQSVPNVNQNVNRQNSCMLISINEIINVNSYKGTVDSYTFHGTFCFHLLNKLSHHITRPNIRAPWSESLSLNNEVNNCPSVRVCRPSPY